MPQWETRSRILRRRILKTLHQKICKGPAQGKSCCRAFVLLRAGLDGARRKAMRQIGWRLTDVPSESQRQEWTERSATMRGTAAMAKTKAARSQAPARPKLRV